MENELKQFFFDYHTPISSEAMAILWATDAVEAEDIMLR